MPFQRVTATLLVIAFAASAIAQPPEGASRGVFDAIEAAWRAGDAGALTRHLGAHGVSIGLPEVEPAGGHFSRSQSFYILKAHFEATRIQEFEFEHVREAEQDARVALGLANRRYRGLGDGRVVRDRVLVVLGREGTRWVVAEIRALR